MSQGGCSVCGARVEARARFCSRCGTPVGGDLIMLGGSGPAEPAVVTASPSRWRRSALPLVAMLVAGILALTVLLPSGTTGPGEVAVPSPRTTVTPAAAVLGPTPTSPLTPSPTPSPTPSRRPTPTPTPTPLGYLGGRPVGPDDPVPITGLPSGLAASHLAYLDDDAVVFVDLASGDREVVRLVGPQPENGVSSTSFATVPGGIVVVRNGRANLIRAAEPQLLRILGAAENIVGTAGSLVALTGSYRDGWTTPVTVLDVGGDQVLVYPPRQDQWPIGLLDDGRLVVTGYGSTYALAADGSVKLLARGWAIGAAGNSIVYGGCDDDLRCGAWSLDVGDGRPTFLIDDFETWATVHSTAAGDRVAIFRRGLAVLDPDTGGVRTIGARTPTRIAWDPAGFVVGYPTPLGVTLLHIDTGETSLLDLGLPYLGDQLFFGLVDIDGAEANR